MDARESPGSRRSLKRSVPNADTSLFSIDTQMPCEHCGFVAYNDTLSCVQWCRYARKCVGDEMYEHMMEIAAIQKNK